MYGQIIRRLLDEKLTTLKELEQVTGRGTSTIYRWMRGESEPHAGDLRQLVREVRDPRAKRLIVSMLIADLPLVVHWIDQDQSLREQFESRQSPDGHDVVDMSLMALAAVTELLVAERESIRTEPELTEETYTRLVRLTDDAVRYLTTSRLMLDKYLRKRRKAAPVG